MNFTPDVINTLYTHNDFDGIGSASIFLSAFSASRVMFTAPKQLTQVAITDEDAVLDLPFVRTCACWFDHHEMNFDEPRYHGIDPDRIPGLRKASPSCAQVIFDYLVAEGRTLPPFFPELVREINRFDAMLFDSLADWMTETPGKIIHDSLFLPGEKPRDAVVYYRAMVDRLRKQPIAEVASEAAIINRWQARQQFDQDNIPVLRRCIGWNPSDPNHRMIILDFTALKYVPVVNKNYILIDYPEVDYIMCIYPIFDRTVKTVSVSLSIARNFLKKDIPVTINLGDFFTRQQLGGGHADAAGGKLEATQKPERDRKLARVFADFFSLLYGRKTTIP